MAEAPPPVSDSDTVKEPVTDSDRGDDSDDRPRIPPEPPRGPVESDEPRDPGG